MKRSQADIWFSKCIRARADYKCEKCGKQYDQSSTGLHCSHNFSRRHRTIRWCTDNAFALCFKCHQDFGSEPYEAGKWLEEMLGTGKLELLIEKKNSKVKITKLEEKEIASHYKEQFQRVNDGYELVSYQ